MIIECHQDVVLTGIFRMLLCAHFDYESLCFYQSKAVVLMLAVLKSLSCGFMNVKRSGLPWTGTRCHRFQMGKLTRDLDDNHYSATHNVCQTLGCSLECQNRYNHSTQALCWGGLRRRIAQDDWWLRFIVETAGRGRARLVIIFLLTSWSLLPVSTA
jgi:hypothetical protein